MLRDSVVEVLCGFHWDRYGILYAVLFGSTGLGAGNPHDIDIAIACRDRRCGLETVLNLYADLASYLEPRFKLPLDLAVLDWDPPCELVTEVWRTGVLVYTVDRAIYVEDMVKRVMICYDWSVVERKLGVLEVVEKVVLGGNPPKTV